MECSVDDGSIDGVFQSTEDIIAKIVDWRSRNSGGGGGSWDLGVLVKQGVDIVGIIAFGNWLLGDDGGDIGGEGEGVVEQNRNRGRAVPDIEGQIQVEIVWDADVSRMGSYCCWL